MPAGTPADKILSMISAMQCGSMPSLEDMFFVQSAILQSLDIYKPVDVAKQLLQTRSLDVSEWVGWVTEGAGLRAGGLRVQDYRYVRQ